MFLSALRPLSSSGAGGLVAIQDALCPEVGQSIELDHLKQGDNHNSHSSGKETMREDMFLEHQIQIRGWIAVSSAGLQGEGGHKRNVTFTDTGYLSLSLSLYIYIYMYIYKCVYIYIYTCVYMYTHGGQSRFPL